MTVVQDLDQNKLRGKATRAEPRGAPEADELPDPRVWTHLLSFNGSSRADYVIETYAAKPEFPRAQSCYGQRHVGRSWVQEVADRSFSGMETHARRFAMEALQLEQAAADRVQPRCLEGGSLLNNVQGLIGTHLLTKIQQSLTAGFRSTGACHQVSHRIPAWSSMARRSQCRRWLPRLLLLSGALYAALLLVWHARRAAVGLQGGSLRTRRPRLGEELVLPEPTHAWTPPPRKPRGRGRGGAKKRVVLSPQGQAAIRRGQQKQQMEKDKKQRETQETQETQRETQEQEEPKRVTLLADRATQRREWRCIGWRATAGCSAQGPREPERDATCAKLVAADESGYCELEDKTTGERVAVLRRACSSLRPGATFRCSDAWEFVDFPLQAAQAVQRARQPGFSLPGLEENTLKSESRDGIVMVVYPKLLASAYATLRVLRQVLHCELPVEIWYTPSELQRFPAAMEPLRELASESDMGVLTFREVDEATAKGFRAKVHAIYHSSFERLLFLDADNVPVRDPSFLFQSKEFQDSGAVFWPDFWHPGHSIFNVNAKSLLWELLDMPFANMFEQESGQLLIDRRRHAVPLELVRFYAFHQPNLLDKMKLVHGDKDLFRLAWLKLNQRFHMVQTPPAVAGKVIGDSFCGMTMVQHDLDGEVLFLHRNSHKLTGRDSVLNLDRHALAVEQAVVKLKENTRGRRTKPTANEIQDELDAMAELKGGLLEASEFPDPVIWTHLLSFRGSSRRADYVIKTYNAAPEFPEEQHCYGQRYVNESQHFVVRDMAELGFSELEKHVRRFAVEEATLHQKKLNAFQGNP